MQLYFTHLLLLLLLLAICVIEQLQYPLGNPCYLQFHFNANLKGAEL